MGLSRVFGCFSDPEARSSQQERKKQKRLGKKAQAGQKEPVEVVPATAGNNQGETELRNTPPKTSAPAPLASVEDDYEPHPHSMGAVARRLSQLQPQLAQAKSEVVREREEAERHRRQSDLEILREAAAGGVSYVPGTDGPGIRAAQLLGLPTANKNGALNVRAMTKDEMEEEERRKKEEEDLAAMRRRGYPMSMPDISMNWEWGASGTAKSTSFTPKTSPQSPGPNKDVPQSPDIVRPTNLQSAHRSASATVESKTTTTSRPSAQPSEFPAFPAKAKGSTASTIWKMPPKFARPMVESKDIAKSTSLAASPNSANTVAQSKTATASTPLKSALSSPSATLDNKTSGTSTIPKTTLRSASVTLEERIRYQRIVLGMSDEQIARALPPGSYTVETVDTIGRPLLGKGDLAYAYSA